MGSYHPMVVGAPVVIDRSSVGSARSKAIDPARNPAADARLSEAMRKRKCEQLEILKIGDKEKRIQAIRDLAPFSFDNEIRRALEKILLSDPDPQLRQEVAVSFGKTENQLVLAALAEAKEKDPVRDVRQAAYRSIIMIKGY
jgi:HEAT repeat protein